MAADWIKMRSDIYRDPKVSVIAEALMRRDSELSRYVNQMCQRDMTVTRNVMRNVTVGALVSIWGVMRQRGKRCEDDLFCDGVSVAVLDDIADLPGIGDAMSAAGWVIEDAEGIRFPNFFEGYNVDPTEKNANSNAERQRRYRERKAAEKSPSESEGPRNAGDVTRYVTVTPREEKRREENSSSLRSEEEPRKRAAQPDDLLTADLLEAEGVSLQHARDWLKVRAKHKAPLTRTAWDGLKAEALKAGISAARAVQICAEKSWRGFDSTWDWPGKHKAPMASKQNALESRNAAVAARILENLSATE